MPGPCVILLYICLLFSGRCGESNLQYIHQILRDEVCCLLSPKSHQCPLQRLSLEAIKTEQLQSKPTEACQAIISPMHVTVTLATISLVSLVIKTSNVCPK